VGLIPGCSSPGGDPAQYTLSFDSHGGSAVAAVTASEGAAVQRPADPTRTGYVFQGWFSAASGGTAYTWPHTLSATITMHAQWLPALTLSFDSHGGSTVAAIDAAAGTAVSRPEDPGRTGYVFQGWFSAASGGTLYTWPHTLSADLTMHAQWRADTDPPLAQYTIAFDSHGGSAVATIDAAEGTAVSRPEDPGRTGYAFQGWFSAASGGTAYTWPHTLNADLTMHAQWAAVNYTITYSNLHNGANSANPGSYTIENNITLAPATRTAYTFAGWHDNADLSGNAVASIPAGSTGNKTFWARWTALSYTIAYNNLNGGTNGANPGSYTIESAAIALAPATRTAYTFAGWHDNAGLSGDAVAAIPAGSTGDKTFWARWTVNTNSQSIILSIDDFAGGTVSDTALTLTKPGGTRTVTITGSDNDAQAIWHIGLGHIGTGSSVELSAANLSLGTHTLRVSALFGGARYSKEITLRVE
jgi:uncharacterized repeat protein (TIGR02543 family)